MPSWWRWIAILLCWLVGGASGWAVNVGEVRAFNLPAGPAAETLRELARQAGVAILFTDRAVEGVRTGPVRGRFPAGEAMALVLAGTPLEAVREPRSGGFTLRRVPAVTRGSGVVNPQAGVRMEPFLVTGSNIPRLDVETVQPVTVLDDRDLRLGAAGTPLEWMQRLPYLGALSAYENQDGGRSRGSASSLNLRGLGGQNTLLLLNGRRLPYYSLPLGALVFYNLNNLPLMAVSRVEVLRDGASAIYGADATAGVINFITRRAADERRAAVRFGDTLDGAAPEHRATLTHAQTFGDGRTGFQLTLDAFRREVLMARDRGFAVLGDKRGRVPEPFGSVAAWNHLSNLGPLASFTVEPAAGQPNRLPGLPGNTAHVAADGRIVAGNRTPANYYNDAADFSLVPGRTSRDLFAALTHRFGQGCELFVELGHNEVRSRAIQSPMPLASAQNRDANDQLMVVPASNFHNPWGSRFFGPGTANPATAPRAVQFNFLEPALGPRIGTIATTQYRVLLGGRGAGPAGWGWESALLDSGNGARDSTENSVSRRALLAALARPTPDALNLFAGPGANPESVLAPLRTTSRLGGESRLLLGDFRAYGPVRIGSWGGLSAAWGAEYREEQLRSDHSANYVANDLVNTAGQENFRSDRDVRSAYLELQLPLARTDQGWWHRAEVQLAGRWENFSGFGSATKPRAGVAVGVVPGILLRASVGQGFRAPTLTQLYGSEGRSMAARVDPFRPQDGNVRRLMRQPAVPTLRPEHSRSRTIGLLLEPRPLPGLTGGLEFWHYLLSDQINVIARDQQLVAEATGGPYSNPNIIRLAPTAADPIGPIVAVIEPWRNFARAATRGVDAHLAYSRGDSRRGRVTVSAETSYTDTYEVQGAPGGPVESFPLDDNRPRLRGVGRVELERGSWRGQLLYRHVSRYRPADPVVVAGQSYLIPAYGTWDAALTCRLGATRFARATILTLGVNNLADREPPLYPTRQGYDARQVSPQGRFGYAHVAFEY